MAVSKLFKQREEVKQLMEISGMSESEKKRWRRLISGMLPSELLELRKNLLEQLVIDAQFETIDKIENKKGVPEDDSGLLEFVLTKVLEKADKVEERTKRVVGK